MAVRPFQDVIRGNPIPGEAISDENEMTVSPFRDMRWRNPMADEFVSDENNTKKKCERRRRDAFIPREILTHDVKSLENYK